MKRNIKGFLFLFLAALCLFFGWQATPALAEVEWSVLLTLDLDKEPIDIASSADGKWIYVLSRGEVLIYTQRKRSIVDRIPVDKEVDRISVSPRGDKLFVTSLRKKTFSVINVDFVFQVDIRGAPFKGPAKAPVVIAVFDDYQ